MLHIYDSSSQIGKTSMITLRPIFLMLAILVYLLIGNGLGRMSWDAYHGVETNSFGNLDPQKARTVLYPSCNFKAKADCKNNFDPLLPIVAGLSKPGYLVLMSIFWPLKIAVNLFAVLIFIAVGSTAIIINVLVSMIFYFFV